MNSGLAACAAAVLVGGLWASFGTVAAAEPQTSTDPDVTLQDIGPGLREIADEPLSYVETQGGIAPTPDAQTTKYRGSLRRAGAKPQRWTGYEVNELASSLQAEYPDEWTTYAHSPDGAAYDVDFVFTTKPPASVISRIKKLPDRVRVRWGAPVNAQQLQQSQLAILKEVPNLFPGHDTFGQIGLSPMNTVVGVFIGGDIPDPIPSAVEVSERLSQVANAAAGVSTLTVIAEFDPTLERPVERAVLSGGRQVTSCTAGFGAYKPSTGNYGIVTARHCPEPVDYYSSSSVIRLSGGSSWLQDRDIRWNAGQGHTANAKFRVTSSGVDYTVSSVANPGTDYDISIYGHYGGRHPDGRIIATNVCWSGSTNYYCGGFQTDIVTVGGDSGGPCFHGGAARGVVSAGTNVVTWCANIQALPNGITVLQGS